MSRIHVAIGIIVNETGQFLFSQRPMHIHLGGLWEFPGGKIEPGETPFAALKRELFEEIDIKVINATAFMQFPFDYPELSVLLDFWQVTHFEGKPHGKEGQILRWLRLSELDQYPTPLASAPVMKALNT